MSSNPNTALGSVLAGIAEPIIAGVPRLIGVQEAGRVLGISRTKLCEMVAAGEAPPHVQIGSKKLFAIDDLAAWIDARKSK